MLCNPTLMLAAALSLVISIASPVEEARQITREGTIKYDVRDFEGALQKYRQAYALVPLPALLFNIGQCHRQLRQHDKAVFYFQGYLRNDPDGTHRPLAEALIAESQRAQASRPAKLVMAPTRVTPPPVLAVATPVYKKWWFWTAIGAGTAVVAGAVAAGVIVSQQTLGGLDNGPAGR